jgi:hypothetical protein
LQRRAVARSDRFTVGTSEHDEAVKIWHDCNQAIGEGLSSGVDEAGLLQQQFNANRRCADKVRSLLAVTDDQLQNLFRSAAKEKLRLANLGFGMQEDQQDGLIASCCEALGLVHDVDTSTSRARCAELIYLHWGYGQPSEVP